MRALRRAAFAPNVAVAGGLVAWCAARVDNDLAVSGHVVWGTGGGQFGWRLLACFVGGVAFGVIYFAGKRAGRAGR